MDNNIIIIFFFHTWNRHVMRYKFLNLYQSPSNVYINAPFILQEKKKKEKCKPQTKSTIVEIHRDDDCAREKSAVCNLARDTHTCIYIDTTG